MSMNNTIIHDCFDLLLAADTIPGSGNSDFTVVNGRGQIDLRVDPGSYTVTVQDLEAGVKEYHTESMDFSVPGMNT